MSGRAPTSLLLAMALGLAGCELFVYADRDLIPGDAGPGGGGQGGATTSSVTTSGAGGVECVLPLDCPGGDGVCVAATCADGRCGTAPVPKDTPTGNQLAGDCQRAVCDGKGKEISVADDLDLPIDGDPCTDDLCTAGVPGNPLSGAGTPCAVGKGKVCDGAGTCVECVGQGDCAAGLVCANNVCLTCFDQKLDGDETDVDCGGSCPPCATGKGCAVAADCASHACAGTPRACQAAACDDLQWNGDESDVDCGGSCPPCGPGKVCGGDADCKGGACVTGACAPTCTDGVQNQDETDVDCGGSCPARCADGQGCSLPTDCAGGVCAGTGTCVPASCTDGVQNSGETDRDCGGPCAGCAAGKGCAAGADCLSLVCAGGACAVPSCSDGVKNGGESAKDCGGSCSPCGLGLTCGKHADCQSGACFGGVCVAATCADGVVNQGESDVDCGGAHCPGCAFGQHCQGGSDCASTICTAGACTAPSCSDQIRNGAETDVDCGGPTCPPCGLGAACLAISDCQSGACVAKLCTTPTCGDGQKNGAETGTDCGGPTCPPCAAGQGCASSTDCASPNTCGGGGTASVCGCTGQPTATLCAGFDCGTVVDSCGAVVSCGTCAAPRVCSASAAGVPGTCGCALPGGCTLVPQLGKRFGGVDDDDALAIAVSSDALLLVGSTVTSVDFGGGPLVSAGSNDAVVAKLDLSGNHLWSKRYGDASVQVARTAAFDASGNAVIAGDYGGTLDFGGGVLASAGSTDVFVAKLDAAGNHLWSKRFGDSGAQILRGLGTDKAGNVYLAGGHLGTIDFGGTPVVSAGGADVFLAALSPTGAHLWSKGFGDPAIQVAAGLAVDAAGNSAITGQISGTVSFGGASLIAAGGGDAYLAVFGPGGVHRWSKTFGDTYMQTGNAVAIDASGNVVLVGNFKGNVDFGAGTLTGSGTTTTDVFVAKFGPTGNALWSKGFGDSLDQFGNAVAVDAKGDIVVTGSFAGTINCGTGPLTSAGGNDVFVVKYSASGTCLQARRYGDAVTGNQTSLGVGVDPAGNAYVLGDFYGTLDVPTGTLTSTDKLDIFLLKLSP